nr:response regulator [Lachnospiraceae bacterium]
KVIYVVCEKPGFRSNGLFTELSGEYNAKIVYLSGPIKEEIVNPLCFVVDVTTSMITNYSRKILAYLHKHAFGRIIPIFLIGEPEDLENAKRLNFPKNVRITEFERPVDMKECIKQIEKVLSHDDTDEKKHILVVDDSITFLRLVKKTLEKEYDITISSSAFNCIEALSSLPDLPDLIIIDYMMPACDGLTLCRMIKEDDRTKDIPIIFYSGNSNVDEIIQLMPLIDGYMLKSQPVISLKSYLEEFFKNRYKHLISEG